MRRAASHFVGFFFSFGRKQFGKGIFVTQSLSPAVIESFAFETWRGDATCEAGFHSYNVYVPSLPAPRDK